MASFSSTARGVRPGAKVVDERAHEPEGGRHDDEAKKQPLRHLAASEMQGIDQRSVKKRAARKRRVPQRKTDS